MRVQHNLPACENQRCRRFIYMKEYNCHNGELEEKHTDLIVRITVTRLCKLLTVVLITLV
jgi:hypothetical protein